MEFDVNVQIVWHFHSSLVITLHLLCSVLGLLFHSFLNNWEFMLNFYCPIIGDLNSASSIM